MIRRALALAAAAAAATSKNESQIPHIIYLKFHKSASESVSMWVGHTQRHGRRRAG